MRHHLRFTRLPTVLLLLTCPAWQIAAHAAAAEPGSVEKVHLRAERLPEQNRHDVAAVAARAALRAFLEKNPGIELEPFLMPTVSSSTAFDSGPLMAIAAGIPPHVMFVNFRRSSTYIAQGFLEPLEVLLARVLASDPRVRETDAAGRWLAEPAATEIEAALDQIRVRVPKAMWPVVYREDETGAIRGRHVWCVNTTNLIMALLYRKDLFHAAGLDPNRPPRDWDEFLDYARRLTVPERQQYGFGLYGPTLSWATCTFFTSNGARVVERDAAGQWRAAYDSDAAAEALLYVWRLCREPFDREGRTIRGTTLIYGARLDVPWNRGQLGMQIAYLNEELLSNINPQLVGIAPVPLSPKGTRASEINAELLGVFSGSSPAQKLAAMKYIWFVSGDDAKRIRTKVYVDSGYGQFVSPDLLRRFGYERLLEQVPKEWSAVFDTAMSAGLPEPYGQNTGPIWRYMSRPVHAALELPLGDMPPDEAKRAARRLLAASVQEVNLKLLGRVPPETLRTRRLAAAGVLVAVLAAFALGMAHVWRYFGRMARAGATPALSPASKQRRLRWPYLLIAPALGLIIAWQYVPLAGGAGIALVDYQLARASVFVGLDNFAAALFDDKFWASLGRTFYFVALVIGLGFWPPIVLAILLQEIPTTTAKYVYRVVYYLPAVVSGVIVMFLWRQLYDPSERGALNQIILAVNHLGPVSATLLKWVMLALWVSLIYVLVRLPQRLPELSPAAKALAWLGAAALAAVTMWQLARGGGGAAQLVGRFDLQPLRWIASPQMAMFCVVLPMVWATAGHASILYLAALRNVPEELYEAAEIDGASHWHKVFYIALPRLRYLLIIQFVAAVTGAFKGGTDYILALTGGGPSDATTVLALEVFFRAFLDLRFGVGAAMAWILGALLIGFTAYQLKLLSRAEFKAGG